MSENNLEEQNDLDPEEDLKMDNKIKRLELELKGAKFIEHNPDGIELPPEIEAQMLDQILQFEKMKNDAKEVEIYEFIGKPKFKKIETLTTEEIILEKERLLNLMSKKGVVLVSLSPQEDKEMYRFITEEFFSKTMLNMPIKGFIRHFVYEEYYPNEELNVGKLIEVFFHSYFRDENDSMPIQLLCRKEIIPYLENFRKLYANFELKEINIQSILLKKIKGEVNVQLSVEAFLDNSHKTHQYSGEIKVEVRKRQGIWQISHVEFPKIL